MLLRRYSRRRHPAWWRPHGIPLRSGKVIAEGVWDARGTLGIDRAVPVGLTDILLRFEIDAEADAAKLARLIETTERYCVIYQTLEIAAAA